MRSRAGSRQLTPGSLHAWDAVHHGHGRARTAAPRLWPTTSRCASRHATLRLLMRKRTDRSCAQKNLL